MKRTWLLVPVLCVAAAAQTYEQKIAGALKTVDAVASKGPFQPNWKSLESFKMPQWYEDGKFGIFIHWGVYAVPAFGNEWYPRRMYLQENERAVFQHHVKTYGQQSKFGYKDFIPRFKAEEYDANAWAALFKNAGARFVVPVAEHHDGFPMYDCSFTDWCAAKMGPRRDVVGELAAAVRKQGMRFGASSHRAEHWWFFEGGMKFDSDVKDPRYLGLYGPAQPKRLPGAKQDNQPNQAFLDDWLARTTELVDKYKTDLIWFDWWIEEPAFAPYLQKFASFYYNRGVEWKRGGVAINYKKEAFPEKTAVLDIERGKLDALRPLPWQTDTSIGLKSWGYIEGEEFRSADSLVDDLIDIVSKNGLLLLNVGPRADGTIPGEAQRLLLEMGKWLRLNGEAIYGTRPFKVFGEGPTQVLKGGFTDRKQKPLTAEDIRFTRKGSTVYAIVMDWPSKPVIIKSLTPANLDNRKIGAVRLLGSTARLKWNAGADGLTVEMPQQKPCDYAYVLRLSLK